MASKRPVPYARRILHYCSRNDIKVPVGFHVRSAYKFAVIDVSAVPNRLIATTWYLQSQVAAYLQRFSSTGRTFRVLDFKTGRELQYIGGTKLRRLGTFAHKAQDEWPAV